MSDRSRTDWELLDRLGRGGQGESFRVRASKGIPPGLFAMKIPRLSGNDARRKQQRLRFASECLALRLVEAPGVPSFVECNDEGDDAALYLVMELVDGLTLTRFVNERRRLTVFEAFRMGLSLLDAVTACHEAGLVHRDIKSDNIILRGEDCACPVLVDFGVAYVPERTTSKVTRLAEAVGNQFLRLPEHDRRSTNKRDVRSDFTLVAGLLFYAVYGLEPERLLDEKALMPHQRETALDRVLDAGSVKLTTEFWRRSFQQDVEARWQSRSAMARLMQKIVNATDPGGKVTDPNDDEPALIEQIVDLVGRSDRHYARMQFSTYADLVFSAAKEAMNEVLHELNRSGARDTRAGSGKLDKAENALTAEGGIWLYLDGNLIRYRTSVVVRVDLGSGEVVAGLTSPTEVDEDGNPQIVDGFRVPLRDFVVPDDFQKQVRLHLLRGLRDTIANEGFVR